MLRRKLRGAGAQRAEDQHDARAERQALRDIRVLLQQREVVVGERLDLIFCNESEALGWAQTDDLEVAIEKLKAVAASFVITLGSDGALTFDGRELAEIPPHQVQAVDSNGAGDMFAGAFLYAITRGEDFPTAGRFASLAAGKIVANYGPRLAAPDYAALRAEFFGD